jgi:DNA ligase-1
MIRFENFLSDLRLTSKPAEKQKILKSYDCELLRYLIRATYEPFKMFHVSIKKDDVPEICGEVDLSDCIEEFMKLLHFCENSNSNKQNRELAYEFLTTLNIGSQDLVIGTLNKNWRAGLATKTILKVFPDIVSRFDVQLANTYDKSSKTHDAVKKWLVSYKLDGVRCIALRESSDQYYDKGKWTMYSRKGKEYLTVNHLKDQLEELYQLNGWTFFDGELYRHGLHFEDIQGLVMAYKRGQAPEIQYHMFVAGYAEKFLKCKDPKHVTPLWKDSEPSQPDLFYTALGYIKPDNIYSSLEEAFEQGYEGIMLRDPNKPYDYKRSNALLKLKKAEKDSENEEVITSDCEIIDIECDEIPIIEDEQMHFEKLLVRLIVRQEDGIICKSGSGFSLDFRRKYTTNPEEIIGKIAEFEHQKWGKNGRMRFPVYKRLRLDL